MPLDELEPEEPAPDESPEPDELDELDESPEPELGAASPPELPPSVELLELPPDGTVEDEPPLLSVL